MENGLEMNMEHNEAVIDIKPTKKTFSKIGFGLMAVMLLAQGIPLLIISLLREFAPNILKDYNTILTYALSFLPLYLVAIPVFLFIMKDMPSFKVAQEHRKKLKVSEFLTYMFVGFGAMYISNFISVLLNLLIGALKGETIINPLESMIGNKMWMNALFIGILAPVLEEIVFRGLLINKLRVYGEGLCIFASGFTFALLHGNLSQMLYAFALGMLFAYIALKTGTILYTIILHMIVNMLGSVVFPSLILSKNVVSIMLVLVLLFTFIALGITLFFINKKKIKIQNSSEGLSTGKKIKAFVWNPGMIAYMVVVFLCVLTVIFNTEVTEFFSKL